MSGDDKDKDEIVRFMAETRADLRHISHEMSQMRKVLEDLVALDRRMIRIEEGRDSINATLGRAFDRLEAVEAEVDKWRTFRRVGGVALGIAIPLAVVLMTKIFG
jgi:hypothetical protein